MDKESAEAVLAKRLLSERRLRLSILELLEKCTEEKLDLAEEALALIGDDLLPEKKLKLLRPTQMYFDETVGAKIFGVSRYRAILFRSTRFGRLLQEIFMFALACVIIGLVFFWFIVQPSVAVAWVLTGLSTFFSSFHLCLCHAESLKQLFQTFDGAFLSFYLVLALWAMADMRNYDPLSCVTALWILLGAFFGMMGPSISLLFVREISKNRRTVALFVVLANVGVIAIPLLVFFDIFEEFIPRTFVLTELGGKTVTFSNFTVLFGAFFNFMLIFGKFWVSQLLHPQDDSLFKVNRPRSVPHFRPKHNSSSAVSQ